MNSALSKAIDSLEATNEEEVTTAATRLGLLLERTRFQRRGRGTLGNLTAMLNDLADIHQLSDRDVDAVLSGLRRHLSERGINANPTVVWAIGKGHDRGSSDLVAELADKAIDCSRTPDLVYQALVMLAAVVPGSHKELFVRAAREANADSAEFAAQQASIHSWS